MWLYYITDRKQFPGTPAEQRRRLLEKIAEAARCGVHFIQLREKDLSSRELEALAHDAVALVRENSHATAPRPRDRAAQPTRLLINSRVDVALAVGADGVHLPATDLTPSEARAIWNSSASLTGRDSQPVIDVSCHSPGDVQRARDQGADFAVFAPVFEKVTASTRVNGAGLAALRAACASVAPIAGSQSKGFLVFALGGVTLDDAQSCIEAGAAGVAGIRLFQDEDVQTVVARLADRS
ncbi:MAG TPA: thiamine phosphate synthase [Terriglobales bacterium]|nr:thiamine phosphate synthase [Terriglobales bacterium]